MSALSSLRYGSKWLLLALVVGVLAGSASAFFLHALDWVTRLREQHGWLLWLLPALGFLVSLLYLKLGATIEAGNHLLIEEIHDPKQVLPLRMAPFILLATLASHLGGASVGREGTAVQMGGALADQLTRMFRLNPFDRRTLLMAGIAAGFASVFGTPVAGAIFALEVLAIGRLEHQALFACLTAALAGNTVAQLWQVQHEHYPLAASLPGWDLHSLGATLVAGLAFGLAGRLFIYGHHRLTRLMSRIQYPPLRPLLGGSLIVLVIWLTDAQAYLGLGLHGLAAAFEQPVASWDWLAKLTATVAALGSGFKGGEVTPLFYIGASLGNALAPWLQLPFTLLAAMGLVAVFAGAANTPIACSLLAFELFDPHTASFASLACVVSYLASGQRGIYPSQKPALKLGHQR